MVKKDQVLVVDLLSSLWLCVCELWRRLVLNVGTGSAGTTTGSTGTGRLLLVPVRRSTHPTRNNERMSHEAILCHES